MNTNAINPTAFPSTRSPIAYSVVKLWRDLGITTLQVNYDDF